LHGVKGFADCAMLSRMSSLSSLVELVRNVLGVFIDALSFFRLTLHSALERSEHLRSLVPHRIAAQHGFLKFNSFCI